MSKSAAGASGSLRLLTNAPIQKGDFVRLRDTPSMAGVVQDVREFNGRSIAVVKLPTEVRRFPSSQLEHVPADAETSAQLIRSGKFTSPKILRQRIAHVRMSGNMSDFFYSMESSDTDFYAHQFKPVLKLLNSPSGNLLIADEVGLGKTIEAGLVWMELAARYKYNRFVVVCPKVLQEKWRAELQSKFGIDAKLCSPTELKDALSTPFIQRNGFALVCSMQGIRPRAKSKRAGRPVDELANFLDDSIGGDRLIDLLVIDEAHHMRNMGTQTNALGSSITAVAEHTVLLTATPINLHDRDLHSLLRLVDPMTFRDEYALRDIIRANEPLVAARDTALAGHPAADIANLLEQAARSPVLRNTRSLAKLREELATNIELDPAARANIARRLEKVNLLSNAINRTRRRDVEDFRVKRKVSAFKAQMTDTEREVYAKVTEAIVEYSLQRDMPTGFLTVMPQRMLASCLPAAIHHWTKKQPLVSEDEDDIDVEVETELDDMPLRELLAQIVRSLPAPHLLEEQDTKFQKFQRVLNDQIALAPKEKIVVFSTFRPTIRYLERRISEAGFKALTLHGDTADRRDVLKKFETDPKILVLLASEVASEGIDLQFARTVVNYDLPWNPMRVEQRIGRVDRLGQEADSINVLNLMHQNTIDERIYHRLHERLKLCETALGGFEEILGHEIRELTSDLFSRELSAEEKELRLAQTEIAIAVRKKAEEELEKEAAALFAHGDYIVDSIKKSQATGAWITERDTVDYIEFALGFLHPDSKAEWRREEGLIDVRLDPSARQSLQAWSQKHQMRSGQITRLESTTTYRVGQKAKQKAHARLGPS